jgi:hypothetical protein
VIAAKWPYASYLLNCRKSGVSAACFDEFAEKGGSFENLEAMS